jgi:hypothetical protein
MSSWTARISLIFAVAACAGCWDEVVHQMDCVDTGASTDTDADTDTSTDTDTGTGSDADGGMDGGTDTDVDSDTGQGDLPTDWIGFGAACVDDADCQGYPSDTDFPKCCLSDVLGLINAPGGYCGACCNEEAQDGCAENIDCVGANLTYTICLAHCDSNEDCRQDEGWECRELYYIPDNFPGTYCLPDSEHVAVDTDMPPDDPNCPWPWLK